MTQLTSGRDVYLYQSDLQLAMNNSTPSDVTSNRPCDGTRLARRLLHIFFSQKERKAGSIAVDPKPGLVRLNPTVTEAIIVRCLELDPKTTRGKVRDAMASSLSAERAGSRRKHTAKKRTTKSCNTDQCEQGSSRDYLQEVRQTTGMCKSNEEEFAPLPDTHVTVAGFNLTPDDLTTLMRGDDIVDEVINAYLNVLRLEGSATSYYVFPTQVPLQWGTSGVPLFHGLDVSRYTWLFQPLLVNGKHWVLLAANVADRTVSLLDSLNPLGRPDEEQILNRFRQYMKTREKKMRIPDSMTWTTKRITCSQQKDGHSCGVFVMMNAEALVEGRTPSTFQQDDVPAARVKVYNRLIGYSHPLT
ncbi:hypothetical protein BaRGS_00036860 [Batillaria attramentaria]|uniref:Ubiquitin-like protease family profile domain-containing protein n=1 Tax=Batillaria attramentaria TaxID=370345 RepID=A0ABD0JA94_9CAEN